jgi:hypothetical protein
MAGDMFELTLPPGVDPVLTYARPDVEWLVEQTVKPLGGVVSWAYTASDDVFPGWLSTVNVQVDVRSHRKTTALERADACRRAICALPWAEWDQGVIVRVDVSEGPFWLPDDNGGPRYVARYAVMSHPRAR